MSCNLTSIRLEIQKVTRIHISTRNEPDATTLIEKKVISTKNVDTNTSMVNIL